VLELFRWQDIAIGLGACVGLLTKVHALTDSDTVWPRKAALTNAVFYPPSLFAFYTLELWFTFVLSSLSFIIWIGIALFRSEKQN